MLASTRFHVPNIFSHASNNKRVDETEKNNMITNKKFCVMTVNGRIVYIIHTLPYTEFHHQKTCSKRNAKVWFSMFSFLSPNYCNVLGLLRWHHCHSFGNKVCAHQMRKHLATSINMCRKRKTLTLTEYNVGYWSKNGT